MEIPWEQLKPETLRALAEEYVSREGTDYGTKEVSFDAKVGQVLKLLKDKKIKVVFDAETESCDLREIKA